jgi:hypothetical protein
MAMGRQSKWEYFRTVFARYRRADRETKQKALDEFCANTGYHRKHALRPLNGPPPVECGSSSYRLSTSFGAAEHITGIAAVSALPGTGTSKGGSCCYRTPKCLRHRHFHGSKESRPGPSMEIRASPPAVILSAVKRNRLFLSCTMASRYLWKSLTTWMAARIVVRARARIPKWVRSCG